MLKRLKILNDNALGAHEREFKELFSTFKGNVRAVSLHDIIFHPGLNVLVGNSRSGKVNILTYLSYITNCYGTSRTAFNLDSLKKLFCVPSLSEISSAESLFEHDIEVSNLEFSHTGGVFYSIDPVKQRDRFFFELTTENPSVSYKELYPFAFYDHMYYIMCVFHLHLNSPRFKPELSERDKSILADYANKSYYNRKDYKKDLWHFSRKIKDYAKMLQGDGTEKESITIFLNAPNSRMDALAHMKFIDSLVDLNYSKLQIITAINSAYLYTKPESPTLHFIELTPGFREATIKYQREAIQCI